MGKIKGWTKTYDGANGANYVNKNNMEVFIGATQSNRKNVDWVVGIDKRILGKEKNDYGYIYEDYVERKKFKTKKEAMAYAIKYMRANPNG